MRQTIFLALLFITSLAHAAWTPPDHPDPSKILKEAQADAAAGRYEDALTKQVWFHENALKYDPAQAGVRLSFALSDWMELGTSYPPALEKLRSIRDEDAKTLEKIRTPEEAFQPFFDFASINKTLHDESKTTDLFKQLDATMPTVAKRVFDISEPALVKAKEYSLCGKYVAPKESFEQILHQYRQTKHLVDDPKLGMGLQGFSEKAFSHRTATLVALLVVTNRKEDADQVVTGAEKEWDNADFKGQLEEAQKGNMPAPWP